MGDYIYMYMLHVHIPFNGSNDTTAPSNQPSNCIHMPTLFHPTCTLFEKCTAASLLGGYYYYTTLILLWCHFW